MNIYTHIHSNGSVLPTGNVPSRQTSVSYQSDSPRATQAHSPVVYTRNDSRDPLAFSTTAQMRVERLLHIGTPLDDSTSSASPNTKPKRSRASTFTKVIRRLTGDSKKFQRQQTGGVFEVGHETISFRQDTARALNVDCENSENDGREELEEEEKSLWFAMWRVFEVQLREIRAKTIWDGAGDVTQAQVRSMFLNFFGMMRTRIRQEFRHIFTNGVEDSPLDELSTSALVASLILIDMAVIDDSLDSFPFPLIAMGVRLSPQNCPRNKLTTYFLFMAFKFSEVREDPEGLRVAVTKHFYAPHKPVGSRYQEPLQHLMNALRPIMMSDEFVRQSQTFYDDCVKMETELMGNASMVMSNSSVDRWSTISFQYQLGDVIGGGATSSVYRCYRIPGDKPFALKVLRLAKRDPLQHGDDTSRLEQTIRGEINLLKKLKHSHVVAYFGCTFDRVQHQCEIMMEYLPQTLEKRIAETAGLLLPVIAHYARQILQGLIYLHDRHVVHRDIKSANILLTDDRDVKIGDLGTAINIELLSDTSVAAQGTPRFMAPEVAKSAKPTEASDIWSFGCVLIELATKELPWSELGSEVTDMQMIYRLASTTTPPALPECPAKHNERFVDLFNKCVAIDPIDRPSARQLLNHPFLTDTLNDAVVSTDTGIRQRSGFFVYNGDDDDEESFEYEEQDEVSDLDGDFNLSEDHVTKPAFIASTHSQ